MAHALTLYKMLMGSSILLSATAISLILSFTPFTPAPLHQQNTEKAAIVFYAYALAPSLALIHHILSSLFSPTHILASPTRQSTILSVAATRKQISSTTNLLCLALLAIFIISSGFAVLILVVVGLTPWNRIVQSATIAEGSVAAATGFKDSLASNALVLQALLQITQGIVLGWMFGVAAQNAHLITTLDCRCDHVGIIVHVDEEQGYPHSALSYDEAEADGDEDK